MVRAWPNCYARAPQVVELQQQLAEAQHQVTGAKDETARMVGMLEAGLDQLQV